MQFDSWLWHGVILAVVQIVTMYVAISAVISAAWRRGLILAVAHYCATFGLAIYFAKNAAGNIQGLVTFASAYSLILMISLMFAFVKTNEKKMQKGI